MTKQTEATRPGIDALISEAKANPGRACSAQLGGSTYYVWTDKGGKVRVARGNEKISLKNARAAIAKAEGVS